MAVMAREAWTDERLDDLTKRMDKGFDETKLEIRDLRADMDKGFDGVKGEIREGRADTRELRKEMRADFDTVHARLDSLQRTMIICFAALSSSIIASVLGAVLATQVLN